MPPLLSLGEPPQADTVSHSGARHHRYGAHFIWADPKALSTRPVELILAVIAEIGAVLLGWGVARHARERTIT
jgi:hypothetical protein